MGNPIKGVVTVEAMGQQWRMAFPSNSLVELEEKLDKNVIEIGAMMEAGLRLGHIRSLFWASLLEHHGVTEREAGALMDELGQEVVANKVAEAFILAFPTAAEVVDDTARPPKAKAKRAGTGRRS